MTSREIIKRTISFQKPQRIGYEFPEPYGTDFAYIDMTPSPDARPIGTLPNSHAVDEWGVVWQNIGKSRLGEAKEYPLKDWSDFGKLRIPDVAASDRWSDAAQVRQRAGDKYLIACGITLYERAHFVRGLENIWMDIMWHPKELERLLDVLVEMNLVAIPRYAQAGADGYMFCDDWGLQDRLMISPDHWRSIWKPRYAQVYQAAHDAGLQTFLHSCGCITDILDDLIEVGLDVIQMDQQENMGLEVLSRRFSGRITFWCPVDIQNMMVTGTLDEVRAYCWKIVKALGRSNGGFLARWYADPEGAGHRQEAIEAMCEEFLNIPVGGESNA
jgi:hypothetical protein